MNLTSLFNSPVRILFIVLGLFVFVLVVSIVTSKIVPLAFDRKYRSDQKIWFARNWKWFTPLALLLIASFSLSINQMMKASDIYKNSVRILYQSELAKDSLGEPINLGFFIEGSTSGGGGHITFSVSGSKKSATLVADAGMKNNELEMKYLYLLLDSGTKVEIGGN
ncbi:MAG: cytochrome c oxidase assembly factor Coa1 family protein [Thermotogota bacterium]|nr:cytochrome c oxidase assembly factor Coa1 family protein [Thermotogota bacterium]